MCECCGQSVGRTWMGALVKGAMHKEVLLMSCMLRLGPRPMDFM